MDEPVLGQLRARVSGFPLVEKYLSPSLGKRVQSGDWYDNRVIVYILGGSQWVNRLEHELSEAQFNAIPNSEEIFGLLKGTESDYDQQLFDDLAEVTLARWARSQGYQDIEKLKRGKGSTPDFCIKGQNRIVLAEARRFRPRDYILEYIDDRLRGLAFKTKALKEFGLVVKAGGHYSRERGSLIGADRPCLERRYKEIIRDELTEDFLHSLEHKFASDPIACIDILGGLLTIERGLKGGGVVVVSVGWLSPIETPKLFLSKLDGALRGKLKQTQNFLKETRHDATHAIVFFTGTDEWDREWDVLWDALSMNKDESQWPWDCVRWIREAASTE